MMGNSTEGAERNPKGERIPHIPEPASELQDRMEYRLPGDAVIRNEGLQNKR